MRNLLRDPRNRSIFSAKRRIAHLLCSPAIGAIVRKIGGGVVLSRGLRVDSRSPVVSDVSRARLLWGMYEGAEIRLLKRHLVNTSTIIDLGASLGVLSASAARQLGGRVRVICVEANADLLPLTGRNVRRNAPLADLTVVHGAVDAETAMGDTVFFQKGAVEHTGSSVIHSADSIGAFSAPAVRLGALLSEYGVTDDYVLLADIEGAEAGLFLSEPESLKNCRQMIVEFHDAEFDGVNYSAADLRQLALSKGFKTVAAYGAVSVLVRTA